MSLRDFFLIYVLVDVPTFSELQLCNIFLLNRNTRYQYNLCLIVHADVEFDHAENDALMRFFDRCTRFVQEVENNPSAMTELDKFQQGPEMNRVQQKIADRLGVPYAVITDGQFWRATSIGSLFLVFLCSSSNMKLHGEQL